MTKITANIIWKVITELQQGDTTKSVAISKLLHLVEGQETIHELEQQVSDMALEITRLKKIIEHLSSRTKPKPFYDEIIEDYNKLSY